MQDIELRRTMFEEITKESKTFADPEVGLLILRQAYSAYKKSGNMRDFVVLALGTKLLTNEEN